MSNISAAEMLLLQQFLLWRTKAAFKATKAIIKATTRVATNFSTKGTKVVIKGSTKAKEKDTRVAVNGMTMVRRVVVANQLQIMVKILLPNVNLSKNVNLPHPHILQRCPVVDGKRRQWLKRENQGRKPQS